MQVEIEKFHKNESRIKKLTFFNESTYVIDFRSIPQSLEKCIIL